MHPDVSTDPSHVEVFKRVIVAYESLIQAAGPTSPPRADTECADAEPAYETPWEFLKPQYLSVVTELRRQIPDLRRNRHFWAAAASGVAADVLEQAVREFDLGRSERLRIGSSSPLPPRPLLIDAASKFVASATELLENPDNTVQTNLSRGALGAIGHQRVSNVVGRDSTARDKELFARAAMSSLASVLLRHGLIGAPSLVSSPELDVGAALMEAATVASTAELSTRGSPSAAS